MTSRTWGAPSTALECELPTLKRLRRHAETRVTVCEGRHELRDVTRVTVSLGGAGVRGMGHPGFETSLV